MPVRETLTDILAELRGMTDLVATSESSPDYGLFEDEALQTLLDRFGRVEIRDWATSPVMQLENGYSVNTVYDFPVPGPYFRYEVVTLVDSSGYDALNYTVDYTLNQATFTADQSGYTYRLRGNGFNLNAVAAKIWKKKAALRASMIQFKAGDHTLYEYQEYEHCLQMAQFYGGNALALRRIAKVGYA